ncbi:MAG: protein serine/threonine phosphatase [Acidobacteria bacterium]|nr:protein serine/threonine phosphatase [Acidobacteriota bacterium]
MQKTKSAASWTAWAQTDPGKNRENNEDRILCEMERGIFAVVDGMGGEAAGEIAAQEAVDFIKNRLHQETGTIARRLREAIAGANNTICRLAERNPEWKGMACVLTAAVIEDGMLHIGHVGDSRLYQIRNQEIRKITSDHSPIGQKEESGELSELEAMKHPRRNEVFRDVGSQLHKPDDADFIEYSQIPFERDSAVVLCSDGLSDMLTSNEILQAVVENAGNPRDSVRHLIEKANAAGGKDNISAIVVEADGFAEANAGKGRSGQGLGKVLGAFPRHASHLHGRWAFLCFGLLAGLLAAYGWHRFQKPDLGKRAVEQAVSAPKTLRVNPAGLEYTTIGKALDQAQAGDRIEIGDGEYEEAIRLKEGVELFARSPGRAIVRVARPPQGADAAITADGLKQAGITGLVIRVDSLADLAYGIRISNSGVYLTDIEVSGSQRAGIMVDGNSTGTFAGGYIHDNVGTGITVSGDANPSLVGNVIYANGISRNHRHPGLYISGNANPEVRRNVFSRNGAEAIRLQRQELKDKMKDNLFLGPGKPAGAVAVEKTSK